MLSTILTAIVTFAATNVDDIFILILFFGQTGNRNRKWQIITGQYVGFTGLALVSMLGFLAGLALPKEWIGLLGFGPIYIGIKKWVMRHQKEASDADDSQLSATESKRFGASAVMTVAAVTFANGGDNIGIYSPLFASSSVPDLVVTLLVFYVLIGCWCLCGDVLSRHPKVSQTIDQYGHVLVPFVLISLGIFILIECNSARLLGIR